MVDETLDIQLHFQSAVPVFKCKHGSPVEPEIGFEEFLRKNIIDFFVVQILIFCEKELHDLHGCLVAQCEFIVRVGILPPVLGHTHERVVGVFFVQPVKFIQHRGVLHLKRWNGAEKIPETFKMIFHLTAAPDDKALLCVFDAVTGASGQG